jgi:hypothetical protein
LLHLSLVKRAVRYVSLGALSDFQIQLHKNTQEKAKKEEEEKFILLFERRGRRKDPGQIKINDWKISSSYVVEGSRQRKLAGVMMMEKKRNDE